MYLMLDVSKPVKRGYVTTSPLGRDNPYLAYCIHLSAFPPISDKYYINSLYVNHLFMDIEQI